MDPVIITRDGYIVGEQSANLVAVLQEQCAKTCPVITLDADHDDPRMPQLVEALDANYAAERGF